MKKTLKKIISKIVPKGQLKEQIKVLWYNLLAPGGTSFYIHKNDNNKRTYQTRYSDLVFKTNEPLYQIVHDFSNYQKFYKVKPGDIVLDVGANLGHLSLLFLNRVGPKGRVYAFEPDLKNVTKLQSNLNLNTYPGNFSLCNELLWSDNTMIDFQESGTVASSALWFDGNDNIIEKKAVTLDTWIKEQQLGSLDFIKMDIEGAELKAMKGCKSVINNFQPNFAIASYHMINGEPTYKALETFFSDLDYPFKTVKFAGYEIITFAGPSVAHSKVE